MSLTGWAQIALVLVLVVVASIPLSGFLTRVFKGERNILSPVFAPVERGFYRLAGVDPEREQGWLAYTMAMIAFSIAGFLSLYALQRLQNLLPLIRAASTRSRPSSPSTRRAASSPTRTGRTIPARPR